MCIRFECPSCCIVQDAVTSCAEDFVHCNFAVPFETCSFTSERIPELRWELFADASLVWHMVIAANRYHVLHGTSRGVFALHITQHARNKQLWNPLPTLSSGPCVISAHCYTGTCTTIIPIHQRVRHVYFLSTVSIASIDLGQVKLAASCSHGRVAFHALFLSLVAK